MTVVWEPVVKQVMPALGVEGRVRFRARREGGCERGEGIGFGCAVHVQAESRDR